jgi:hypothetical protein
VPVRLAVRLPAAPAPEGITEHKVLLEPWRLPIGS